MGKDYVPIRLLNITSDPVIIYKGTPAGVVTSVTGEPPVPMATQGEETGKPGCGDKIPDFLKPLCKSGGENLSEGEKELLT